MAWSSRLWPLSLIVFLCLMVAMIDNLLWQSSSEEDLNPALFPSPLGEDFLNSLSQVTIQNAQGNFVMEIQGNGNWLLMGAEKIEIPSKTIALLRQSLGPWQIIKVYRHGPKLPTTTGLETPYATVTLIGRDQSRKELTWGLINPLDQSTFVEIKGGPYVYQIKDPEFSWGTFTVHSLQTEHADAAAANVNVNANAKSSPTATSIPNPSP